MIKNLLYSLFLHFLLLLGIYANFNLKEIDESKTTEIAVSLISLNGSENSSSTKPSAEVKEEAQAKPVKKIKVKAAASSDKKSKKNQVKEVQKKLTKSTPAKAVAKPVTEESSEEFKPQEVAKEIPKEVSKPQEDDEVNKNHDAEEHATSNKEKDLGAEKKIDKNTEESEAKNADKDSANMASNIETLDLSAREKFNIQSQLKRCYNRAVDETKLESNLRIVVKAHVSEEGYIDSDLNDLIEAERYNNPKEANYKIAIDNARRALDLCSPLRNLPLDKYDVWKEVILEFGKEE
jgi:hypothetical protein